MKYELESTSDWKEAEELAAEGWRLVAVTRWQDSAWKEAIGYGRETFYFERKQKVTSKKKE